MDKLQKQLWFDTFWKEYPKKVGKKQCKAYCLYEYGAGWTQCSFSWNAYTTPYRRTDKEYKNSIHFFQKQYVYGNYT